MSRVRIGIYFDEQLERLHATLQAVRATCGDTVDLLLLCDGVDFKTRHAASRLGVPYLIHERALGEAACFNRLAASSEAEVVILLEAGCVPSPQWLERLLAALDSDPCNGIAGPSTNLTWNEQCAFSNAGSSVAEVAATAHEAAQRFGSECTTLEPLHSLGDFCYAVKREVIRTLGAADERYHLGPCWEMDYNIRAHRAGFRGVWARSAYVHRAAFTARRAREEARRFEISRRRYQDKFCGLRLSGASHDYEPHCRGDACEHFAPVQLIQVHLTPREAASIPASRIMRTAIAGSSASQLVTCIMTTRNRPDFVRQSIRYFQRQDYPHRELIVLHDSPGDLPSNIEPDNRISFVELGGSLSIGAKRNRGSELARGSFIAHWDDDDWYSPGRLSIQLAPLLEGRAEISALQADLFFELPNWKFWRCTPALHRRLFVEDVHGGTLVYKRLCWEHLARFPEVSLAEDAAFLCRVMQRGARLERIANNGAYIYLRHPGNSWSFECGAFVDPQGWSMEPEPQIPAEDRAFYAARSSHAPPLYPGATSIQLSEKPLVSCIMPTANRRSLVPQAIHYFLRQDYPNRELIVVDDGDDPIADLMPDDPRIHYMRLSHRSTIGAKRNLACEQANGEIIAHWDDDDWIASWRLSYQVEALKKSNGKAACGLSSIYYHHPGHRRAWIYVYPERQRPWLAGGTLCYHKELWQQHRFPNIDEGEDTRFVWSLPQSSLLPLHNHTFYAATVHERNTSPKRTQDTRWLPRSIEDIQSILGSDFLFYQEWQHEKASLLCDP